MKYEEDRFGKECLKLAQNCKSPVKFGAVLVKNGRILGRGWNRLSTKLERSQMSHVDYCIHAEQAAILDANSRHKNLCGGTIFVLGMNKNRILTTRTERVFVCRKCPVAFKNFELSVHIPHIRGWHEMSAEEAMKTGRELWGNGYWNKFAARS